MTIEDTTKAVFGLFVAWVYSKSIYRTDDVESNKFSAHLKDLYELAILADRFLISQLQNDATEEIYAFSIKSNELGVVNAKGVYSHTIPGSPLRMLTTILVARCIGADQLEMDLLIRPDCYHHEFLVDMLVELKRLVPRVLMATVGFQQFLVELPQGNGEKAAGRKGT